MEQNQENRFNNLDKITSLIKDNKKKFYLIIILILIIIFSTFIYYIYEQKKNISIAERYIQAGLLLSSEKRDQSKKVFEDIIKSKNSFYSILSLNTIIEENLETDESKILNYFQIVENLNINDQQKDILTIKKALFLIKIGKNKLGKKLLKKLSEKQKDLNFLIDDILIRKN